MVFSNDNKIIIQNDYEEKSWSAYKTWKYHPTKKWDDSSVKGLLKNKYSMGRRHGSGRSKNVSTKENMNFIEELICSGEGRPHTHLAPRKITEQTEISRSSIRRMKKKRNLKQFKRLKTPQVSKETGKRKESRASSLRDKPESNIRMIEKAVWQDERDFTLEVPVNLQNDHVYAKGKKSDIPDESLLSSTNKMSRKVMVSAAILWYGVTKPFFVNKNGIKVNKENYCRHLRKELFPAIEKVVKLDDWIFA